MRRLNRALGITAIVTIDPKSKEGKLRIAQFRSDGGTSNFKEPGPSWFRNMFVERPQRQEARMKIQRFMRDEEYVVILNGKNALVYWT